MSTIALQLKESTRSAHTSAEGHSFQRSLGSGTLPLADYRAYLAQLFLTHSALEAAMLRESYIPDVVTEEQFQRDFLRADLKALGLDSLAVLPLPHTAKMLHRIEVLSKSEPVALLGFHYVLLGSKHGGKFIASVSKKSYNLENGGTTYFDPYGPDFQPHWKHFTSGINELVLTEKQTTAVLAAASEMFEFVENLGEEILKVSKADQVRS